ncbi:MAG: hypothetical protein ACRDL5_06350 [Solirubrobacteraceae bacterium]
MTTDPRRQLDWASAQVRDGSLTVELSGRGSKVFNARLAGVLALLSSPHHGWGRVRISGRSIRVAGLSPGSELELRHFLESAVLEANAELAPPQRAERDAGDAEPEPEDDQDQPDPDRDQRMAETFRGFATE